MPKKSSSKAQTTRRVDGGVEVDPATHFSGNGDKRAAGKPDITPEQAALKKAVMASPVLALRKDKLPAWRKAIDAKIKRAGGIQNVDLETFKDAIACAQLTAYFAEREMEQQFQALKHLNEHPLLARRILAVHDELHVLLGAESKHVVRACELLSALQYVSKNPNRDHVRTAIGQLVSACMSKTPAEVGKLMWQIRMAMVARDNLDVDSIGFQLGKLICDAVTTNNSAKPSFFERLSEIWKGIKDNEFETFASLAGKQRDKHLRLFYLVTQARMPPSEDASSPNAKLWPSRDEFIQWLKSHGLAVSKSWLSGLFKGDPKWGRKPNREVLKHWLSDKLGIIDPPEPVLSEYLDKHNNAMPALSSLIGNAKGKRKRVGGKLARGKQAKR